MCRPPRPPKGFASLRQRQVALASRSSDANTLAICQYSCNETGSTRVEYINWKPSGVGTTGQPIFMDALGRAKFTMFANYPYAELQNLEIVHPSIGVAAPSKQSETSARAARETIPEDVKKLKEMWTKMIVNTGAGRASSCMESCLVCQCALGSKPSTGASSSSSDAVC